MKRICELNIQAKLYKIEAFKMEANHRPIWRALVYIWLDRNTERERASPSVQSHSVHWFHRSGGQWAARYELQSCPSLWTWFCLSWRWNQAARSCPYAESQRVPVACRMTRKTLKAHFNTIFNISLLTWFCIWRSGFTVKKCRLWIDWFKN